MARGTFRSLGYRDYRLYWSAQLVSSTGNWLTNLALTLLVLHLTGSGVAVGALSACQYGPILFLSASAGVLADRVSKRKILLVTQTGELLQSVALGALAFMRHPPLAALLAVALAGGVLLAADNPVRKVIISELVSADDLPNAVVLYSAVNTASQIIGPAIAGLLIVGVGFGWCFLIDAASYLLVIAALLVMRTRPASRAGSTVRARGQLREGMRYVWHEPTLRVVFVVTLITGLFIYRWNITLPLLAEHALRANDRQFTLLFAVFSLGALVGALASARVGHHAVRATVLSTFPLGVALMLLASAPDLTAAYPMAFVTGVASIVCLTSMYAVVQMHADRAFQGRVVALQAVVMLGTTPLGGLVLGMSADVFGARTPVALGAATALLSGFVGLSMLRRQAAGPVLVEPPAVQET